MGRKLGSVPILGVGGTATPRNTTSPGPRLTPVPSGILIHPAVRPQETWVKNWVKGAMQCFFGELDLHRPRSRLAEAYLHTK